MSWISIISKSSELAPGNYLNVALSLTNFLLILQIYIKCSYIITKANYFVVVVVDFIIIYYHLWSGILLLMCCSCSFWSCKLILNDQVEELTAIHHVFSSPEIKYTKFILSMVKKRTLPIFQFCIVDWLLDTIHLIIYTSKQK